MFLLQDSEQRHLSLQYCYCKTDTMEFLLLMEDKIERSIICEKGRPAWKG